MKKTLFILFSVITLSGFAQNTSSFFYGRTTGSLPFLEYGIGEDRLGGAKMTFLDSNILLKVVDSFKTKYKVQLSKYRFAYIDKKNYYLTIA